MTNPRLGESFDIVIGGVEIGSGGTEINDPDEQWLRFVQQGGQEDGNEPLPHDREYVTALKYGAPPSSGAGIGIDRLLMILLDSHSIGEIILFPSG
jgi:lysyl-tRNA synthetase class 2